MPAASRTRRRRQQGRRGQQGQPDKPDKPDKKERPGRLGRKEKKPKQGKTERPEQPVRPEQLERPEQPVLLERLVQTDEKAGRVLIALSGLDDQKRGRECNLPFLICQTDSKGPFASLRSTSSLSGDYKIGVAVGPHDITSITRSYHEVC